MGSVIILCGFCLLKISPRPATLNLVALPLPPSCAGLGTVLANSASPFGSPPRATTTVAARWWWKGAVP